MFEINQFVIDFNEIIGQSATACGGVNAVNNNNTQKSWIGQRLVVGEISAKASGCAPHNHLYQTGLLLSFKHIGHRLEIYRLLRYK